ncbi:SAXO1 protein, partial [Ramphastos sulfuratus]|nr:SAXO1 protein [Ramphastos sulfuratus]
RRDYIAHTVLPRKPKQLKKHVKTNERMDLTSTYKQDYNFYPVSQVLPPCLPCVRRHIPSGKMDGRTTYKDDYVLWNGVKAKPIRANDEFHPSKEKTDYRTVVQDDYLYRGPVATRSCKPPTMVLKSKAPFENMTNYRVNYVPCPLEKRYVHKKEKYKANEFPLDGLTTHKMSYKGLVGQPAKLAKPDQSKLLHDLPFSSITEFQEKYQPWRQPPRFTKTVDVYLPPLEKMDLHTTTQLHYKYSNVKPAKMCKSLAQIKRSTEPFNGSSVMKKDYKPLLCERLKPIIHAPELTFQRQPMDCVTTFQTDYVPRTLTVAKSFKPDCSHTKHCVPLDAKTVYATTYTPKGIVRCLATYKNPPGYVFEGVSADGHKLYVPASKSKCQQDKY